MRGCPDSKFRSITKVLNIVNIYQLVCRKKNNSFLNLYLLYTTHLFYIQMADEYEILNSTTILTRDSIERLVTHNCNCRFDENVVCVANISRL